ncbi:MAG: hypothetical protein CMP13_09755 [Zunongwangia sp.]|uniref:Uncharacterized protein n=2 Tax=Zunongwangia profunda TaxID=398743 RepID=D5BFA9_ZUNPS|nr:hypothetical protein [Zunongwangia profunda]ADF53007.1 hypothetical protein ZPR_2685 [Zunongwangia profunda SM-A87]MAS70893.1 hypothetical protein [Zunongwangia sp.]HCV79704.1 hypothetical protein [Zunongwangia profunda]|tara:strand:+ start:229 stop:504 length:276 start_codon:yes stop_codon:yes gene_type:complete
MKLLNITKVAHAVLKKGQGKSIRQIALDSDISKSVIDDIVAQKQKDYSGSTIAKIHLYTGLTFDEIFNEKYIKAVESIIKAGKYARENPRF